MTLKKHTNGASTLQPLSDPEIAPTWTFFADGQTHAVLGNYDPAINAASHVAQRLCDQRLVVYHYASLKHSFGDDLDCKECVRIKRLMVEFARPKEKECQTSKKRK